MKRHTAEVPHYNHHERAGVAVRTAREVRKLFKRPRLFLLAIDEASAEAHFADVVAKLEAGARELLSARREMARLAEKRMAIERGIA